LKTFLQQRDDLVMTTRGNIQRTFKTATAERIEARVQAEKKFMKIHTNEGGAQQP
jgi:hypothetical protein